MSKMKSIWGHFFTFWLVLSLPAILMITGLTAGDPDSVQHALHASGEFAARFMIITMMVTPLMMLFKKAVWPRWLMKRRRYLGVAAFFYALLHTVLYLVDEGAMAFSGSEISKLYIWTGWLAFLIFVPLAVTSIDGWVSKLGRKWNILQKAVYGAAVLTLIHWAALHDWGGVAPALVHFLPLAGLEIYRFRLHYKRRLARAAA